MHSWIFTDPSKVVDAKDSMKKTMVKYNTMYYGNAMAIGSNELRDITVSNTKISLNKDSVLKTLDICSF